VFGWLLDAGACVHAIDPVRAGAHTLAPTFHGRDLFAKVAARLAHGAALSALGEAIDDPVRFAWPDPRHDAAGAAGEVVHVDRYGNLISNLEPAHLPAAADRCRVSVGGRAVGVVRSHYAQAVRGEALALIGSAGLLEIAVRDGSAAAILGAHVSSEVRVVPAEP